MEVGLFLIKASDPVSVTLQSDCTLTSAPEAMPTNLSSMACVTVSRIPLLLWVCFLLLASFQFVRSAAVMCRTASALCVMKSAIAFAIFPSITVSFSPLVRLARVVACVKVGTWSLVATFGTLPSPTWDFVTPWGLLLLLICVYAALQLSSSTWVILSRTVLLLCSCRLL